MTKAEKAKDARLRREYHITLAEYKKVLKHQGNCCAICKRNVSEFKYALAVDHCHTEPAHVRGLLCWGCNKAVAVFRDSIAKLVATVEYLTNHPVTIALGREVITAPGRVGTKKRAKLLKAMSTMIKINTGEYGSKK